ncbi:MAG: PEP-CTERM sorting domain-containing protein [Luteolibacter sp.]
MKKLFVIPLISVGMSCLTEAITFSFTTDTWFYANGSSTTGFDKTSASIGAAAGNTGAIYSASTTKDGVTVKFSADFVGGTTSGASFSSGTNFTNVGSTLTEATGTQNPNGFLLSSTNNDSTGLNNGTNGDTATFSNIEGDRFSRYQRWYIEFSAPVTIDSFVMEDIDNITTGGNFRDIFGAEAFLASGYVSPFTGTGGAVVVGNIPVVGTGLNPTYALATGTDLQTYNLLTPGTGTTDLSVVSPFVDTGNPISTAEVRAGVTFSEPVQAISVYAISNLNTVHRMALSGSSFTVIPEPSVSILSALAAIGMVARRRR